MHAHTFTYTGAQTCTDIIFREKHRKMVNGMRRNVRTVFIRTEMSSLARAADGHMW